MLAKEQEADLSGMRWTGGESQWKKSEKQWGEAFCGSSMAITRILALS